MTADARLTAVCAGRPESRGVDDAADPLARPWLSAIWKTPLAGPVQVHRTGVGGDEHADTRVHGGPEKAVLAYALDHYAAWAEVLDPRELGPGAFGENLAVEGLDECSVAIGDVWAVGSARLQVAQPRGPCWKLARKFRRQDLVAEVIENGRTGWYLRVLAEGALEAGDAVTVVDRPHPDLTLAKLHRVLYENRIDEGDARAFATCAALADGLRQRVADKLEQRP
ncbi:MAG: MOSC domain-containing protein [Planctomycetota bacterium]